MEASDKNWKRPLHWKELMHTNLDQKCEDSGEDNDDPSTQDMKKMNSYEKYVKRYHYQSRICLEFLETFWAHYEKQIFGEEIFKSTHAN